MALKFFELTEILDLGLDMFKPKPVAIPTLIEEFERIMRDLEAQPVEPNVNPTPWIIQPGTTQPWINPQPYQPYQPFITPGTGGYPWITQPEPQQPHIPWTAQPYVGDAPYYTQWITCNTTNSEAYSVDSTNLFNFSNANSSAWGGSTANGGAWGGSTTNLAYATKKLQLEPSFV